MSILTESDRLGRKRAKDAVLHRRTRGTISSEEYTEFIACIDTRFNLPELPSPAETVTVGKIFGSLTVERFSKNSFGQTIAICLCQCGKRCHPALYRLAQGMASCGCSKLSKLVGTGNAVVSSIRATYKASAKQRNLPFDLDHAAIRRLITASCFYCGIEPYRCWNIRRQAGIDTLKCNGIDRIENERGYVLDNVVPCCPRCNYAKRDMSLQEFAAWALKLSKHLQEHVVSVVGTSAGISTHNIGETN